MFHYQSHMVFISINWINTREHVLRMVNFRVETKILILQVVQKTCLSLANTNYLQAEYCLARFMLIDLLTWTRNYSAYLHKVSGSRRVWLVSDYLHSVHFFSIFCKLNLKSENCFRDANPKILSISKSLIYIVRWSDLVLLRHSNSIKHITIWY